MTVGPGCTGVILAGGVGARLGGVRKGLLCVGGRRMLDRVADALGGVVDRLLLVANDPDARAWLPGVRVVADLRPAAGSLGGLHAALAHAGGPAIVVAWDMPFVVPPLLRMLRATGELAGARVDAVVPRPGADGRVEPLCAYYAPSCVQAIERRLDRGDRRARSFLADVRVRWVEGAELVAHGDPELLFANVNTHEDLARAAAHAGAGA